MQRPFKIPLRRLAFLTLLLFAALWSGCRERQEASAPAFENHPLYKNYRFSDDEKVIELGVPTPWSAVSHVVEVMRRDEILRKDLGRLGYTIKFFPFLKGDDIHAFIEKGALEGAVMGDMPTLISAAGGRIVVMSLFHRGSVSLVSRDVYRVRDLKGKKVAYPHGTIAHYYLLSLLKEKGMSDTDIRHAPMDTGKMFEAIEQNRIDAFTTFEPTATMYIQMDPTLHTINRSFSSYGFFSLRKDYAGKHPRAAQTIIAAQFRAAAWLRKSGRNIHEASRWVAGESAKITDLPLAGHLAELDALCAQDLLGNAQVSAQMLSEAVLGDGGALQREFEFLQHQGFLPRDRKWKDVAVNIDTRAFSEALKSMPPAAVSRIMP